MYRLQAKLMKPLIVLIYCVLAIKSDCLRAQTYSSVRYDAKDGLPSATVYDITEDKDGFIWFGTENGLCRFDGKNFKTFTTKDGLPDNSILKVHGDNSGRVFFTPFTHSLHYFRNDSFFKFPIPEKYKRDLSNVGNILKKGDQILIAGIEEAYIINGNHMTSFTDKFKRHLSTVKVGGIYDTLLVLTAADTIFFFPDTGNFRFILSDIKNYAGVILDEKGHGKRLDIGNRSSFIMQEILNNKIAYEYLDNTAYFYDLSTGSMIHKIRMEKLSNVHIDNEDNLWISTLGEGVYRYPSFGFRHLSFDGKSEIFSLIITESGLLAGTDFSKIFNIPVKNFGTTWSVTDMSGLTAKTGNPHTQVTKRNRTYVFHSAGSNLYIGTDAFLLKKTGTSHDVFRNIFPIKDIDVTGNNVLVCTSYHVLLLDDHSLSVRDTLLNQRATCGVAYRGDYYVGTLGGLIKINPVTKAVSELYKSFPAFSNRIVAIKRGIDDDLWIATSGSGLVHFKNDKIVKTLKESDGLTGDICTSLFIDSNLVWLGTSNGLNRIETGKEKAGITRFTSANGLGADFINAVIATDSNVYVGTAAGLTAFNKNILTEKSACILHIEQVSVNNKKLKKQSHYSLPHNALNIEVDFTAISFKSAGDITYYYQLEGLDKSWNTTTANFINFPTLQPDNYTLRIKAVNKFGIESDIKSISITIQPAWWQTWLFRIIVLAALGILVLLIYRYNIRNVKRKAEMQREIEARFAGLEQRALQAQMNPHFIFNSLNSIQTFILNLDVEGANTYLSSFASLIRQNLENSMQPFIPVASELKYLETYLSLEKLRFRDKFAYSIEIDEGIDQNNTLLPGMLLQPYIENAIRHGIQHRKDNNGLISLTIRRNPDDSILYTIKDNGVGRKQAEAFKSTRHIEYQSRGMSINEKRIAAINNQFKTNIRASIEDVVDDEATVTGTSVTILIPPFDK
jgi:hypothetical protein